MVDYCIKKLKRGETSVIDRDAGGFLKRKMKEKVEENEKAILNGVNYGPVNYESKFKALWVNTENR